MYVYMYTYVYIHAYIYTYTCTWLTNTYTIYIRTHVRKVIHSVTDNEQMYTYICMFTCTHVYTHINLEHMYMLNIYIYIHLEHMHMCLQHGRISRHVDTHRMSYVSVMCEWYQWSHSQSHFPTPNTNRYLVDYAWSPMSMRVSVDMRESLCENNTSGPTRNYTSQHPTKTHTLMDDDA